MNIVRCQTPASSATLKISIERSVAVIPTPAAIIFRLLVDSINAEAIAKKVNEKPVIVANMECRSSSSTLNPTSGTIGAC